MIMRFISDPNTSNTGNYLLSSNVILMSPIMKGVSIMLPEISVAKSTLKVPPNLFSSRTSWTELEIKIEFESGLLT